MTSEIRESAFQKESAEHHGQLIDQSNGYDVIDCTVCGFKHILPVPTPEELTKVYEEEYYSQEKPDYIKHYEEDGDWWNLSYDDRLAFFEQHLPDDRRRVLDIGSGPGFFLRRAKERGWQTLGIEPSRQAAEYSSGLGLDIRNEFLSETTKGLGRFDVVHMSAVLEHIPDPVGMLRIAHELLLPDGLICIIVPNDYSPFQLALREARQFRPWWLAAPHHINYFDPPSLEQAMSKAGFELVDLSTTFPIDLFLLMGDNYTEDPSLGRQCHQRRKAFEFALRDAGFNDLRRELYRCMIKHGIGREVVLCGRRS
jgi:SAM-dependent methyltransferase